MFEGIIGHRSIIEDLLTVLEQSSPGAYLFEGPPSTGKRTIAFEFARGLLCQRGDEPCESCKRFPDHPDFLCLGQEGRIKVDAVDAMLEQHERAPFLSKRRVSVLDNAEAMTPESANRLLKTIEEPQLSGCFVLVTTDRSAILPTIVSRCLIFRFGPIETEDLINILWKKMGIDLPKARVLGWLASGSTLDIFPRVGTYLTCRDMAMELIKVVRTQGLMEAFDYIERVEKKDADVFAEMLICVLGDLLVLKTGSGKVANVDIRDHMAPLAEGMNFKGLMAATSIIGQVRRHQHLNVNLLVPLKNALLKSHPYLVAT